MQQKKKAPQKKQITPKPVSQAPAKWPLYFLMAAIAVVTIISFSPAQKNTFINWDDNGYVFENKNVMKPLPEAAGYFFGNHIVIGNYHPLTMIVLAAEYSIAGLDAQFFHRVNVLLHVANVLLVFWFIYLLSRRRILVAAFVSLFFGIHPMHVESVAWIAELKDVLYSFFFLSGLIVYCKYLEMRSQAAGNYPKVNHLLIWTFILFFLSALSKPAAVTFPMVLLLVDYYTGRKFDGRTWLEKAPFFVISIVFGIIAIISQKEGHLVHDHYPFWEKLLFASRSVVMYIVRLVAPVNLSIFYPYPRVENGHLPYFYYVAPVLVALLFYGVYRTLKYTRLVAFGFLFFFVNVLLVLQLLSVGDAIMADRYTYIPYIGLLFIIGVGLDRLYNSTAENLKKFKAVAMGAAVIAAICCSYLTYARCEVWHDDDTIADDLLQKFPDDALALNNKGFILYWRGDAAKSMPYFIKAIQVRPDYIMAYINLANSYLAQRDFDNALKYIEMALVHAPSDYNLLTTKGFLILGKQRYQEAMALLKKAISIKKDNVDSYRYLAECYYDLKDYDSCLKTLNTGLSYDPDNIILLNSKGYVLYVLNRYPEAIECYKAALKIRPDYQAASINLADCYKAMNDSAKLSK